MNRMLPALLLALATPAPAPAAAAEYTGPGRLMMKDLPSAPFPHPAREHGHRYRGTFYPADRHYSDSTVAIFIPDGFRGGPAVDLVFHFHGWFNHVAKALDEFALLDQFAASGCNAVLVVPQGPRDAADSFGGKIEEPGGFERFLADVMAVLHGVPGLEQAQPGRIILSGHSGGYRVMAHILDRGGVADRVKEVWLFDALYAETEKYQDWWDAARGRLLNIYTERGGTKAETERWMAALAARGTPFLAARDDAVTPEALSQNRLIFLTTDLGHDDVLARRRTFERFIRTSCLSPIAAAPAASPEGATVPRVVPLDGQEWLIARDPQNVGRSEQWWAAPRAEAKPTRVPWIIQDAFPGYHGVAWYWRAFTPPRDPHAAGRCLLRFWAVDYAAEAWLNGTRLGAHEGGESPFTLDATDAIRPGAPNLLAVRVLNPVHEPIDGIVLGETPHRNKALPYTSGSAWNQGGIIDSVELLITPAVRLADLVVRADPHTGVFEIEAEIDNARPDQVRASLAVSAAPANGGETIAAAHQEQTLPPGPSRVTARLAVPDRRLWELNDPFLYRVTARVQAQDATSWDETSLRTGFRDFRFERGYFRLNGRRIYVRSSHTGNCCPIGLELPHDPDLLRRDLINAKAMRFNMIRFIAGVAKRYQLDLCDEIGLMVYEESYAAWCLADSPHMARRYDESVLGMVRRDRHHPSVDIWGLLNETPEGPVFRHAAGLLPELREIDDSRLVLLNSGRWDQQGGSVAGIDIWHNAERTDPCVTRNGTDHVIRALGITWAPAQLALHPGRDGDYAALRWTAPEASEVRLAAVFRSIAEHATTDVHVLHNGRPLFDGAIHVGGAGPQAEFAQAFSVAAGDHLDFICGFGNGDYGADTTALAVRIDPGAGRIFDAAADFSPRENPSGTWSYGQLDPGVAPDAGTFRVFPSGTTETRLGSLSNPGSATWQDVLADKHPYQRVPHTAETITTLRTIDGGGLPLFLSEYGIGSAVDLPRAVRWYEQLGKTEVEDAQFYRARWNEFLADWARWRLAEAFARPEDFFTQSNARMAEQRLLGLNAIRANPSVVGYSLTGTVDQGMTGEGLWTTFREPKPGTADALSDGFAPLRWCLFAEPVHVYRRAPVRLEALLANEDALAPGEYPVRLAVVGPAQTRVLERSLTVTVPGPAADGQEPPLVLPVFRKEVLIDGPPGRYRFLATFERGAAAAGEEIAFHVDDPETMPPVETEVVLCGDDPSLARWLSDRGIRTRPFAASDPRPGEVILVAAAGALAGDPADAELIARIEGGATAVFLSPAAFAGPDHPAASLPPALQGALISLPSWLYHKDEWAKQHPIFAGLPAGGLLDYTYYRELIPDHGWTGSAPPDEAVCGGINAAQGYSSGLFVAVYRLGAGRCIINTLRIRESLGANPAAERLLRNMLRYGGEASDVTTAPGVSHAAMVGR